MIKETRPRPDVESALEAVVHEERVSYIGETKAHRSEDRSVKTGGERGYSYAGGCFTRALPCERHCGFAVAKRVLFSESQPEVVLNGEAIQPHVRDFLRTGWHSAISWTDR